ncbi:MAG: aminoglycoside phosphotransferase family protein [Nitrososphaerota archaeon]|nr:aminoglycoside phosphotransferase family protein [Nitrososphaerota archaeon]
MRFTDLEELSSYLERHGISPGQKVISIEEIKGGVSADVYRVKMSLCDLIVKVPLGKLKVEREWISDTIRGRNEFRALYIASSILGNDSVPKPYFFDDESRAIIISAAPAEFVTWKSLLMSNHAEPRIAEILADNLGRFHKGSMEQDWLEGELTESSRLFYELRLSPYFEQLLPLHTRYRENIIEVIRVLRDKKCSLVHGDFSPKNILTDGTSRAIILDWEVIHYGNPVFDLGFMCTHLTLKAIHLGKDDPQKWLKLIHVFYDRYNSTVDYRTVDETEFFKVLGALLVARVDGKSPAEYLSMPEKDFVRSFGLHVLSTRFENIDEYCSQLESRLR